MLAFLYIGFSSVWVVGHLYWVLIISPCLFGRLLAFHVLADDDSDDVKDIVVDSTGRVLSYSRYWNEALCSKIKEHQSAFHAQLDAFNCFLKKRTKGEAKVEESIMVEHLLLQDERRKMNDVKEEVENLRRAKEEEVQQKELAVAAERERVRTIEHHRQQALLMQEHIHMPGMGAGALCMQSGESRPTVCTTMQDSGLNHIGAIRECPPRPPIVQGQHPYANVVPSTAAAATTTTTTTTTASTMQGGGSSYRAPSVFSFQMQEVENGFDQQKPAPVSTSISHGLSTPIIQGQPYNSIVPSKIQGASYRAPIMPSIQMHETENSIEVQESGLGSNLVSRVLPRPILQGQHPYNNIVPTTSPMQGGSSYQAPRPSGLQMHGLVNNGFEIHEYSPGTNPNGSFQEPSSSGLPGKTYPFVPHATVQGSSSSLYRGRVSSSYRAPGVEAHEVEGKEDENACLNSASPDQEGIVEDLLDSWNEDRNVSMNLLAPHSSSNNGGGGLILDLNSLTSTQ